METPTSFDFALKELREDELLVLPDDLSYSLKEDDEDFVERLEGSIVIHYKHRSFVLFAIFSLANGVEVGKPYSFNDFGVMVDCSRDSVPNLVSLKRLVRLLSLMGYTSLQLYTEDTYEIEGEPCFGARRGRYKKEEIKELDEYSKAFGIELIPCIETLAHLERLFVHDRYKPLRDSGGILLVDDPKTYEFIEKMVKSAHDSFSSRRLNIGMDEAFGLGRGAYLDRNGFENPESIMMKHLTKVLAIVKKYGFEPSMWGDMFYRLKYGEYFAYGKKPLNDIKAPSDVQVIYWDYYHEQKDEYSEMFAMAQGFSSNVAFAGGAWTWNGFAPFNRWSRKVGKAAIESCIENNVKDIFVTMWGDNGGECSPFLALPGLLAESLRIHRADMKNESVLFEALAGVELEDFLLLDDLNNCYSKRTTTTDNPSKYLLYNDLLNGLFDSSLPPDGAKFYAALAEKLSAVKRDARYNDSFAALTALAKVLASKVELGKKLREDYAKRDFDELRHDQSLIRDSIDLLKDFYEEYRRLYLKINKPFGFDVSDIRLGGLLLRMEDAERTVGEYVAGKTKEIPQLEEEPLPPHLVDGEPASMWFNDFLDNMTTNAL